jgi:hypothetical protein
MKTAKERAEEKRREKLAAVDEQIRSGSLVVRQMTASERARYPPPPTPPPKRR